MIDEFESFFEGWGYWLWLEVI